MKLLTRKDHRLLVDGDGPVSTDAHTWQKSRIMGLAYSATDCESLAALVEQGRMRVVRVPSPAAVLRFHLTTDAGREALKLWPTLIERGLVTP